MLDNFSKIATVTKIRAKQGKMLTKSDYRELISKKNVAEIAEYLKKNTHYSKILSSVNTSTIHRGYLEALLRRSNFDRYVELCKFQKLDNIEFYNYQIVHEEIEQILSCVLHINANRSDEYITSLPSYMISHSSFDMLALAKSRTFTELLNTIKDTEYYKIIKGLEVDSKGRVNYLLCEVRLRTYYYKTLIDNVEKSFKGEQIKKIEKIIKTQLDLINIINSYRMKAFFNADSAKIKQNMFPFNGRVNKANMNEIYEASSKEEMISLIQKTMYFRNGENIKPEQLETKISRIRYNTAKSVLSASKTPPVALFSFLILCQFEIQNIISIIEGIRYNVEPSEIEKLLVTSE